jgi:hypothetical protein
MVDLLALSLMNVSHRTWAIDRKVLTRQALIKAFSNDGLPALFCCFFHSFVPFCLLLEEPTKHVESGGAYLCASQEGSRPSSLCAA